MIDKEFKNSMFATSFQNFDSVSLNSFELDEANKIDEDSDSGYSIANQIKDFNVNLNWNALMEMHS